MAAETDRLLARALVEGHPADAARILERFVPEEAAALLDESEAVCAGAALEQMDPDRATACLASMSPSGASRALEELDLDSAAALLRRAPAPLQAELLGRAGRQRAAALQLLLASHPRSAGSFMDPQVLALPCDIEVVQALDRVRAAPRDALEYAYVVDRAGRLVGVLSVREMLTAPPHAILETSMRSPVMRLHADDDRTAILAHPGWNEFHALPVVDGAARLLGAVRYETLRRLESEGLRERRASEVVSVAVSLGELYWIGLCGLLEGLGAAALRAPDSRSGRDA